MAVYKPERIIKLMREKNFPCYILSDGKNEFDSQLNEKMSVNEACDRLTESLSEVSGNDVSVEIAPAVAANGKLTGRGKMNFERVDLSNGVAASKQVAGISGFQDAGMLKALLDKNLDLEKRLIEAEAQKKIDAITNREAEAQKKIDALTNRMEQLEKGEQGGINGIFNNLLQNEAIQQVVAGWLMNATGMAPTTATLNGVNPDVDLCIERLLKVDPDFINNLHKLADLAEQQPAKYRMAVSML